MKRELKLNKFKAKTARKTMREILEKYSMSLGIPCIYLSKSVQS